jgi:hypothetical protein
MILTTHILTGAVLGREISNPYAVAGLAVAAHFILDTLPHGDYLNKNSSFKECWKVIVDLAIGLGVVYAIIFSRDITSTANLENIAIGIFFSLLPDGMTLLYMMGMKFLKPIKKFHERLHCYPESSPKHKFHLKNNLFDILISLIAIVTLLSLR